MIIKSKSYGQLCNKIYDFATFLSFSIEHKQKLFYPNFREYEQYFNLDNTENNKQESILVPINKVSYRIYKFIYIPFIKLASKLLPKLFFYRSINSTTSISDIKSINKLMVFDGAWYTNYSDFIKHQITIKEYFSLKPHFKANVDKVIIQAKKDHEVLVGIHMRRGDYKTFLNGKFYYDDDVYLTKMHKICDLLPHKKVAFLLCSNEEINFDNFKKFNIVKPTNFYIEDLYALAACDYLLGPPSTFTMWASFYGNTPLYKLENPEKNFDLLNFEVLNEY